MFEKVANISDFVHIDPATTVVFYDYIFTPSHLYNEVVLYGFSAAFLQLFLSAVDLLKSFALVILYISVVTAKICTLGFPYLFKFFEIVFEFHRTQLGFWDLVIEALVIFLSVVYFLYRKRLATIWKKLEDYVAVRSRIAARMAPHVLFFTSAAVISIFGRKFLAPIASVNILPVITLFIPLMQTIRLLQKKDISQYPFYLKLWITLAVYHTISTGISLVPFSSIFYHYMPLIRSFVSLLMIWAQVLPSCSDILFQLTTQLLQKYINMIPAADLGAEDGLTTKALSFLSLARVMRIITLEQEGILRAIFTSILQEGVSVLMALAFCCMPSRVASVGVIILALLFPAYKSLKAMSPSPSIPSSSRSKNSSNNSRDISPAVSKGSASPTPSDASTTSRQEGLLHYWLCLSVLWLLRVSGNAFWSSITMILVIWLQSEYLRGAAQIIDIVSSSFTVALERNRRIQDEARLRRTAVQEEGREVVCVETVGNADAQPVVMNAGTGTGTGTGTGDEHAATKIDNVRYLIENDHSLTSESVGGNKNDTNESVVRTSKTVSASSEDKGRNIDRDSSREQLDAVKAKARFDVQARAAARTSFIEKERVEVEVEVQAVAMSTRSKRRSGSRGNARPRTPDEVEVHVGDDDYVQVDSPVLDADK
eukprot:gene1654-3202_t